MSAATLNRIVETASDRLAVASYGTETLAIGIDTMTALGVDAAETLFARVAGEQLPNEEINVAILRTLDGLQRSIVSSFEAFGVTDHPFLDQCLQAAASGFLDRGEVLFSALGTGGRA